MNNSRSKRKSTGSVAFSDLNLNDLQNDALDDSKGNNRKNDFNDENYSQSHVSKVYQDLVTEIMYSMFNPYVSFPEKRYGSTDDFDLEDDPNIPITEDYSSPVTSLKLKVASKEDDRIRDQLLQYTNNASQVNSDNLNNPKHKPSNLSFISVDLSLPQVSKSRNLHRKEQKAQKDKDIELKNKKDQRNEQVRMKREIAHNLKEFELQEERIKRREKYYAKEESMSSKDKKRLEEVRRELREGQSRASASVASRSIKPDDNQTSKTHEYLEYQKSQKQEFLKTRGKTKKQDNIAAILMGNY